MILKYGHLNDEGLKLLKQKNDKMCEGCIYGKIHRLLFPKTSWIARAPFELVHTNICGPIRIPYLIAKYTILFFMTLIG